jgi:hypothetical protein
MKLTLALAAVTVAAFGAAGLAVAKGLNDSRTAHAVGGTFAATTASRVETRTCTTDDGKTLVTTTGTYTGASSGDADLTGAATLRTRSAINTTDDVGVVNGTLRIDVASGRDTVAGFDSVYTGGKLAGLASGRAHQPAARLVANVSAGFSPTGGFTDGKIGSSTGGAAVELAPGRCRVQATVKERSEARGIVSAVSAGSITVAGLTCAVPAELQSRLNGVAVNSRAEIHCRLQNGANTLTSISHKRK